MAQKTSFKFILAGSGGCGKTSLLKKIIYNTFEKKYIETRKNKIHDLKLITNYGTMKIEVVDCAGTLLDKDTSFMKGADGAIILYDLSSKLSQKQISEWVSHIYETNELNIPIVIYGNKEDVFRNNTEISVKSGKNIFTPFEHLLKIVTNYNDIQIE